SRWARQFFWVALAETVRLTSNSRTSTFKLHIRPKDEISNRLLAPIATFEKIATRNIEQLRLQKEALTTAGFVSKGWYSGNVEVEIGNSARPQAPTKHEQLFDILVTSPPYGDNATTVPYGQHSYLPLQWISLEDISA